MDTSGKGFAARLRALRLQKGLTQRQLADSAGLVLSAVTHLEHGIRTDPSWSTVLALCKALDVTPNDFVSQEGEEVPPAPERRRGRPRKAPAEGTGEEKAAPEGKASRRRKGGPRRP
jgi:transcriptional regulator with XRE-family HTH domain